MKAGDKFPTWYSGKPDGMSTILNIKPYKGRYNFTHVLTLTAPNTSRGWLEQAVILA
jgi:hypothetical protein